MELWTLQLNELESIGGTVEAWILPEDQKHRIDELEPKLLTTTEAELLDKPIGEGDYALILRQLGGRSNYIVRGASRVATSNPVETIDNSDSRVNEGVSVTTRIKMVNGDTTEHLYWKTIPTRNSSFDINDLDSPESGRINIDSEGNAEITPFLVFSFLIFVVDRRFLDGI